MKKRVNFVLVLVLLLQLCFSYSFPVQALADVNIVDWTNQKAELEENLYGYAAEEIAEYREVAQDIKLQNSWIVWEMSNELDIDGMFEKYFDGYASLQQTLSEIDKRLLLMLYEEY